MKVLLALNRSRFFQHFESVVTALCDDGHEVRVITRLGAQTEEDRRLIRDSLQARSASCDLRILRRRDELGRKIRDVTAVADYAVYFRPQHSSPRLGGRLAHRCPQRLRQVLRSRAGRALVSRDASLRAYRALQARLAPDPHIVRQVAAESPDVLVACPFISPGSRDLEYLRAARSLGIPTASAVASWDNLSSNGTFHLLPDRVLVWNDRLAREAALVHALPPARIASVGAPKFDRYFGRRPSLGREAFCAQVGLDPDRPYLLYVGSSPNISGDESGFAAELAEGLRDHEPTAGLQVLVRPHPSNGAVWEGFAHDDVVVFPRGGRRPYLPEARDDYVASLGHATAALGVNTSAFLEAAIADLPCLSVVSERHREGQVDRGHFEHLLAGEFIETVPDIGSAATALSGVLAGRDPRAGRRRDFVRSFIRPGGIDRPAGEVAAEAILATAAEGRAR